MVVAVEPFPPAFSELEWHTRANGCFNVMRQQIALSDVEGQAPFVSHASASQGHLLDVASGPPDTQPVVVATRTVDALLAELGVGRVKLIKIDVEGAEQRVLVGARRTLQRWRPYLVIDLHVDGEQKRILEDGLRHEGYQIGPPLHPAWWGIVAVPSSGKSLKDFSVNRP